MVAGISIRCWHPPISAYCSPRRTGVDVLIQVADELPDIRGNVVHDLHTAVLMREHGITQICTLDRDFRRFPFLEIVNPLS